MTVISMDRFAALHYYLRYVSTVTIPPVLYALTAISLITLLASSGLYTWNRLIYLIVASGFIVACLLTSSFCYIRIFQIVRRHQMQIHAQQQVTQNSEATDKHKHNKVEEEYNKHFCILNFSAFLLHFTVYFLSSSWNGKNGVAKGMELCCHFSIHDLVHQSIFVLLAS